MNMVTDRTKHPMRGNQLAAALTKSGVVKNDVEVAKPGRPFVALQYDEKALLRDLRDWLVRMVSGERVPTAKISDVPPKGHCQAIVARMKARGFVTTKHGSDGGSMATPKLMELARKNIDDDVLRAIALVDLTDEEWIKAADYGVIAGVSQRPATKMPQGRAVAGAARDKLFIEGLRNWLLRGAAGEELHASDMLGTKTTMVYTVSPRLQEAGLIERHGVQGNWSFSVSESQRERVHALTDNDLIALIWPSRARDLDDDFQGAPPPIEDDVAPTTEEYVDEQAVTQPQLVAVAQADPVAVIFDQILQVLTRMDKRFDRLERALGMPPLEQEVGA